MAVTAIIRKDIYPCSGKFKNINSVLQYILLNSEPTVSFLLFKKKRKNTNRTAKAEPTGWELPTARDVSLSAHPVFTNMIPKCIYSFSRNSRGENGLE